MNLTRWERWGATSGLLALAVAAVAVAFERGTPEPDPSPAQVVEFYAANRTELLVQSLLFVTSSGVFLWFLASLRTFLMRAEGGTGRLSTVAFGAGLAWITTNLAVQAPQIALARADGELDPQLTVVVNDIGLALATIADVPVAVLLVAVAVLSWRVKVFPEWVVWLSLVGAAVHLMAWFGIVLDSGPLAPGGLATFVVYPVFVVWLLSITILMIVRIGQPAYAQGGDR